jgi:hypothetical protein
MNAVSDHEFVRPGQVRPDLPARDACMQCGQSEGVHPVRPLTCDAAEAAYRGRLLTAGRGRYEDLAGRDLSATAAALLRERGEFDPADLGHQMLAVKPPLSAAEWLERIAIGEALARYYRHPSMVHDAVKAGVGWEQIGAARGVSAGQARRDYRDWADGQHRLHAHYGKWGLDDAEYTEARRRASESETYPGGIGDPANIGIRVSEG